MDKLNVERLLALDEAATAGPWEQESGYLGDEPYCSIYVTKPDGEPQGLAEINDSIEAGQGNAELVTYLRNAVPAILAILAMAEDNARMREALERIADGVVYTSSSQAKIIARLALGKDQA